MGVSGLGREGADAPTRDVNAENSVKFRTAPQIAQRAADLVGGDRDREHGKKKQNFDNIAAMWNGYLGIRRDKAAPLDAVDVGHMMVAMKIARTQSGALNVDDYVDAAGYAACAGEVAIGLAPPEAAMPYGGDRGDETSWRNEQWDRISALAGLTPEGGIAPPSKPNYGGFGIGDSVVATFTTITPLGTGKVVGYDIPNHKYAVVWKNSATEEWYRPDALRLAREALKQPKFKVGDRVRCACPACRDKSWRSPHVGIVKAISERLLTVAYEGVLGPTDLIAIADAELAP